MSSPAAKSPYAGYRFPAEVISQAVWLYFRLPLSLRMVEEMLAARGILVRWGGRPPTASMRQDAVVRTRSEGAARDEH
jgi:hypothetical protein